MVNKLPFNKSRQVFQNLKQNLDGYITFFKQLELECFIEIFRNLVKHHYGDQDQLCSSGSHHHGIWFIEKGQLTLAEPILKKYFITHEGYYRRYELGASIGYMDMFFHDYNTLNIYATEVSEVLSIRHKVMLNIIQK